MQGLRCKNWLVQNRQGDIKNSIGNGEAKEVMCMTLGHELRRGLLEGMGLLGRVEEGAKGENWDKCNNIINKIYFKRK